MDIKAWSLINNPELTEDVKEQQDKKRLEKFKNLDIYTDLKYPTDNGVGQGYSNDNYDSKSTDFQARPLQDDKGIRFGNIKTIKEDDEKRAEQIENQRIQFIKGVGIYDKFGNFSNYFKGTMTYIINSSLEEGSDSLIQRSEPLLPVKLSMELDGIGGLRVGDLFKVDYLPQKYRDFCYFMVSNINHSIDKSGWNTSIEAMMIADLPLFWDGRKNSLNRPVNFMEWFESTTFNLETLIVDSDNELLVGIQERIDAFQNQINDINLAIKNWNTDILPAGDRAREGIFGGFFKTGAQKLRRSGAKKLLQTRILVNIGHMNTAYFRLDRRLNILGEVKFSYTDRFGEQKTTKAIELLDSCLKLKEEVITKLEDAKLYPMVEGNAIAETNAT